jgi:general L-amino acid transport system permease protein
VLAQAGAVALVAAALLLVAVSTAANLQARGLPLGFEFLGDRAGFKIADTVLPFGPEDSYLQAIGVAVANTVFLSALVCVAATFVGTALGIARLSANPLVAGLAAVWVEAMRNTPPVLLLIFLYALWGHVMPVGGARELAPGVLASIRGVAAPTLYAEWSPLALTAALAAAVAIFGAAGLAGRAAARRGRARPYRAAAAGVIVVGALAAFAVHPPLRLELPAANGDDLIGGARLTPEFATVFVGLTVYTAAFIAEIVRSGVQSVPRGQWEAARALGLKEAQTLRLVAFPQMLRVIVPPMTSQYINTVKNSTLAIAIGYSEFMTVMGTVINRTNHPIEGTLIIVLVYLALNLALAALLDVYNRRVQLEAR